MCFAAFFCATLITPANGQTPDLELLPQLGHSGKSYNMAIHPNGRWVATSGSDIRIWDIYSRRLLRVFRDADRGHSIMAFSKNPNSTLLLSTSNTDKQVHLWDIELGQYVKSFDLGADFLPNSIVWKGDANSEPSSFFVTGYQAWAEFKLPNTRPTVTHSIDKAFMDSDTDVSADSYGVRGLDAALMGNRIVVLPELESVLLRYHDTLLVAPNNAKSMKDITKLALGSRLYSLDYCPSKQLLAVATDADFQVFDLLTGTRLYRKANLWHDYEHQIKISENGEYLFLDYSDSADVVKWRQNKTVLSLNATVTLADFTFNDQYLIVGGWSRPMVFSLKSGNRQDMDVYEQSVYKMKLQAKRYLELKPHISEAKPPKFLDLKQLEFVPDPFSDSARYSASWDDERRVFSIFRNGKLVHLFPAKFSINGVPVAKVSPDNESVWTQIVSEDGKYLYAVEILKDPRTTERLKKKNKARGYNVMPTSGYRRQITKYECATGKVVAHTKKLKDWVAYKSLQFINEGSQLMVKGQSEVFVFDTKNLKLRADWTPKQPKNWFSSFDVPQYFEKQKVVLVYQEGKMHFWSAETYESLGSLKLNARYSYGATVCQDSILLLAVSDGPNDLYRINLNTRTIINRTNTKKQNLIDVEVLGEVMILFYRDGTMKICDLNSYKVIASCFIDLNKNELVVYTDNGLYYGNKSMLKFLTMTQGLNSYSISQLDHKFNKPHEVLNGLPFVDPGKAQIMERIYQKRLKQYSNLADVSLDQSPEIVVTPLEFDTYMSNTYVRISAKGQVPLASLHISVNGVPIGGRRGSQIDGGKIAFDTSLWVDLTYGDNELLFSVKDSRGLESSIEKRKINSYKKPRKDSLIIISIATSLYQNSDYNLQYAVKDGKDLLSTVRKLNMRGLPGENIDPSKYHLRLDSLHNNKVNRKNFEQLKHLIMHCRPQDKVIITMSGHGLLDENLNWWFASYNMDFEKPGSKGISYSMIMELMEQSPSRYKMLLLDACHSGELDRSMQYELDTNSGSNIELARKEFRGAKVKAVDSKVGLQNSYELMKSYFMDMNQSTGVVVISAASGDSYALESDQWQNGVFSYCVIKALMGAEPDLMKDGLLVSELQNYVQKMVPKLTGGKQKPMTRAGSPSYDFILWN